MTVKVYKKRIHWYFKYRQIEYSTNVDKELDLIAKFLDKTNVIYFKIFNSDIGRFSGKFGLYRYFWEDFYRCSDGLIKLLNLISPEITIPNIVFSRKVDENFPEELEIVDFY